MLLHVHKDHTDGLKLVGVNDFIAGIDTGSTCLAPSLKPSDHLCHSIQLPPCLFCA